MSDSYLTNSEADALAATIPALEAWPIATSSAKTTALQRASSDVDNAMPYQGRRYASDQVNQFPRVPYDDPPATRAFDGDPRGSVWDWDADANAPLVPD